MLQTCPRSFEYSYLRQRVKSSDRPALNFGGALHLALAYRYNQCGSNAVTDEQEQAINEVLSQHFLSNPQPIEEYRNLEYAQQTIKGYNSLYGNEPFTVLKTGKGNPFVEASFSFPLGSVQNTPVYFSGRIDLGFSNNEGEWILDHKTSSQFGQSFEDEMAITPQLIGYCWAFQQAFGRKPLGYWVNAIRSRPPTKDEKRKMEFGEKGKPRTDNYKRLYYYVTDDMIAEWKQDTIELVSTYLWHHDKAFFPRHKKWCVGKYGQCQYYSVCSLPRERREWALSQNVFMDNTWSPLNSAKKPNEQDKL